MKKLAKTLLILIILTLLANVMVYANLPQPGEPRPIRPGNGGSVTITSKGTIMSLDITQPPVPPGPGGPGPGGITNVIRPIVVPTAGNSRILKAYISGYPDGSFRPDNEITRAEVAVMLYKMLGAESNGIPSIFDDVQYEDWYYESVCYLTNSGVIVGYPDGTYKPNQPITRAEFTTLLIKYMDAEQKYPNSAYPDLSKDHWAYNYIMSAHSNGWIVGYPDGTFGADRHLTRAEAVIMINSATERNIFRDIISQTQGKFNDVDYLHWGYVDIELASQDIIVRLD